MKKSVSKPEVVVEQPKVVETKIVKKAIVEETTPEIEAVVEEKENENELSEIEDLKPWLEEDIDD